MKYRILFIITCVTFLAFIKYPNNPLSKQADDKIPGSLGAEAEPWTDAQLMSPADLASVMNNPAGKKPFIFCVGPGALIKGSVDTGPAGEKENLNKLKVQLGRLPATSDVVIYCGCCPFVRCPNIRPAFELLNEMKFSKARLLNIEHNIRTDWVNKGYPSVSK